MLIYLWDTCSIITAVDEENPWTLVELSPARRLLWKTARSAIIMAKSTVTLFPQSVAMLKQFGENLRLARLRRNITAKLEAERVGISISTLSKIERGDATVSIGSYMQVLVTLNMAGDILKVAADDTLGRTLQDLGLPVRARASKRRG